MMPKKTRYATVATNDDDIDVEKHSFSDSEYSSSASSSRSVSETQSPMLRRDSSAQRKASAGVSAYSYRAPRRFSRYFTLALGSTLLIFMFTLVRMSWSSARAVGEGKSKAKAPPAVWESFPFLKRYHGGVRTLVSRADNKPEYPGPDGDIPEVPGQGEKDAGKKTNAKRQLEDAKRLHMDYQMFNPYPDYSSQAYRDNYTSVIQCYLDPQKKTKAPMLHVFPGVPNGFPTNVYGSYELLGLRDDVCFDRFGRLGPYGLGYSRKFGGSGAGMEGDREGIETIWEDVPEVDFTQVKWAAAQKHCEDANKHRFKPKPAGRNHFFQTMAAGGLDMEAQASELDDKARGENSQVSARDAQPQGNSTATRRPSPPVVNSLLPRTAVIIRTWWDYKYDDEDLFFLRALINELSLLSGGEYTVHFLIHVKDDNKQIWADDDVYQQVLDNALPKEFRGMGTLWSERQMGLIYGGVAESMYRNLPVHGAYRSTFMPVQYFAHQHPEYDFFWHWEMDIRYTGNFYHLFDKVTKWAKEQPRKELWERNGRFYVPSEHGTWEEFKQLVKFQTQHGTNSKNNIYHKLPSDIADPARPNTPPKAEKSVWGPERLPLEDLETKDDPVPPTTFEEDKYEWGVGEDADFITFNPLFDPSGTNWILAEDVTGYNTSQGFPPRRTAINTASRLSKRLLNTMHRETALKRHSMFSEMWPGSCALHHGYKAVYAPHPVFIDRRWPTDYLASVFNNGQNGASGGARTSVFSDELQHNFLGTTWYYHAGFPGNLWKRWMGYKVDNDGGEEWEVANEGRMCLPAMLLHPVKHVDMIIEHKEGEL